MKSLLPSLKERKRYVVYEISSDEPISANEVAMSIKTSMQKLVGDLGLASAGIQFLTEQPQFPSRRARASAPQADTRANTHRGIVRVSNTMQDTLKASFTFIDTINQKKVIVRSVGTSGIIAKARKKYMGG